MLQPRAALPRLPRGGAALILLLVSACTSPSPSGSALPVRAERAEVPTVVTVSWQTDTPSVGTVTATFDGEAITVAEAEPTADHAVDVVGLPPLAEVAVHVEDGDAEGDAVVTTGGNPAWVPDLTLGADTTGESEGGYTLAPAIVALGGGILAIDEAARAVWAWPTDDAGFDGPPFRARRSLDGTAMLTFLSAPAEDGFARVVRVPWNGRDPEEISITGAHTDMVEYAPGAYLALAWDVHAIDGRKILGDTVVERAADGTERVVWSVWDDFAPDLSRSYPNLYAADPTVEDWSHVNGIAYDPVEDAVYVTMTFDNGVAKIDRATGELLWLLTDYGEGDFTNTGADDVLALPHAVDPVDGGVVVFSRGNPADPEACSSVVEMALDEDAGTADPVWRYTDPSCLLVTFLGSAERLPGGNTLAVWSTAGQIDEVTPDGEVAWRVNTAFGAAFGFSERVERLGP